MRWGIAVVPLLAVAACADDAPPTNAFDPNAGVDAGIEPEVDDGVDAPIGTCAAGECCIEGSLPAQGMRIVVRTASCTVARGRSVHFDIGIETKGALTSEGFKSVPPGGLLSRSLQHHAYNGASAFTFLQIDGGSAKDRYCACDVGYQELGPYEDELPTVPATSHFYPFTWSGRRWNGPSDTSEPEGAFFDAGPATMTVTFEIDDAKKITVMLPFTISE
jgi:hypothetical protein